jgi:hypothetical protein
LESDSLDPLPAELLLSGVADFFLVSRSSLCRLKFNELKAKKESSMSLHKTLMFSMLVLLVAVLLSPAAYAQVGDGGNTCVFVFGTINGRTVTTPSVMIVVPPTSVVLGPTRVHVDSQAENILGFTLTTPGVDQTVNGTELFVPGVDETVPSFSATINNLNVDNKTCVNFGVTTPAVPIEVPASVLATPGTVVSTPEVTVNALGTSYTVDGQTITIGDQIIVIPGVNAIVPSVTVDTPNNTIAVDLNGVAAYANCLQIPFTSNN